MFNDSYKLLLLIAELTAIIEVSRADFPDCLTIRLEALVRDLRDIHNSME